ncbi:hypothetical protein DVH05_005456 [Phytophthora capsici]|nr:hypothetical protein DVH05_005456 [Phytophthora capsici]
MSNDVVAKFKGLLDDAPVAASSICGSKFVGVEYVSDGPDSDDAGTLSSGDGDDPWGQGGPTTTFSEPSDTSDSVVEFSSSSPVASTVTEEAAYDKHGIPFSVIHGPPPGGRSNVWSVIHFLEKPIHITIGKKAETFTTVCLECAKDEWEQYGAAESWKKWLCNNLNTSNAKEHLRRAHEDHPIVKVVHDQKLARGKKRIQEAQRQLSQTLAKRQKSSLDEGKPSVAVKSGDLKSFWRSTDVRNTNTEMSSWLINDGLPYNVVQSRHFKSMMRTATGRSDFTVLAATTYNDLLDAHFHNFCQSVSSLLQVEHEALLGLPFLNLMHDSWTNLSQDGIVGASIAFLDRSWNPRHIALLATAKNDGHESVEVKDLIDTGCSERFGIRVDSMVKFTISDTAPAAKKISKEFDTTLASDCVMHVLNLCILYGLGLRDNWKMKKPEGDESGKKRRTIVTPGGAFPKGASLVKKVRKLNNYFTTTNRIARLEEVQKFFQYPVLKTKVDVEVRVASTITVFQRTIVNFKAFEKYFERCDSDDDPSIFNALSADDWKLMVELEAVMNNISRLALVEIQREHLLASENIVLMKLAIDKLNASSFACMDIDAPRTPKTNAANFPRVARKTEAFLQETTTGIARTIGQMKKRFPKLTTEIVMPLLKNSLEAREYEDEKEKEKEEREIEESFSATFAAAESFLQAEHRQVYKMLHANASHNDDDATESADPEEIDGSHLEEDDLVPMQTCESGVTSGGLDGEADKLLQLWKSSSPKWHDVAVNQNIH